MTKHLYTRYGGMKPGTYKIVQEEYDYYVVKWRGHLCNVPKNLFEHDDNEIIDDGE
jgi:hypothetical protein